MDLVKVICITNSGSRTELVFFNTEGFDVLFIMHIFMSHFYICTPAYFPTL